MQHPALVGLDGFSHVVVTRWADQSDPLTDEDESVLESTPYIAGPDRIGVFATRSPRRPSPLGLTVAAMTSLDQVTGRVGHGWIDAFDGTPVVDIKPYYPSSDRVRDVRVPDWCADWPQWLEASAEFDWASVLDEN